MILREHAAQFGADAFAVLGDPCNFQELLRVICEALNLSAPVLARTPRGAASQIATAESRLHPPAIPNATL